MKKVEDNSEEEENYKDNFYLKKKMQKPKPNKNTNSLYFISQNQLHLLTPGASGNKSEEKEKGEVTDTLGSSM